MEIENRPYGPDSTQEEIEMLRNRVTLLDQDTVHFFEVPVMSIFQIEIVCNEIGKYLDDGAKYLVINLTVANPPDSPLREQLKKCYSKYTHLIHHVSFYTGKNTILNLIAKYMVRTVGYKKYTFHKTKEQALSALKNE